jgi:hypothetical protein
MFERFSRNTVVATGAALLAALGVGTAAIAQSSGTQTKPAQSSPAPAKSSETPGVESTAPESSATDGDNVQYTAPGDKDAKAGGTTATSKTGASEAPGSEQPGDDGPGGHADEPGNPNADHQAQGVE